MSRASLRAMSAQDAYGVLEAADGEPVAPASPSAPCKIDVFITRGQGSVWNVDDDLYLRNQFHIVSTPIGTIPRQTQQTSMSGAPFLLPPEALRYLIDEDVVTLRDGTLFKPAEATCIVSHDPTESGQTCVGLTTEMECEMDANVLEDATSEANLSAATQQLEEQSQMVCVDQQRKDQAEQPQLHQHEGKVHDQQQVQPKRAKRQETVPADKELQPQSESKGPVIIKHCIEDPTRFISPAADNLFMFPTTRHERSRYLVFRDLLSRGYFVSTGIKFGGDFLVYPGDPNMFHAHYVAVVVDAEAPWHPTDMVSSGRLGTTVKKSSLMCSVNPSTETVNYITITWAGLQVNL
eukprot:m.341585 g.341585  ORF g.341585 m.341585 type:complete len:350 (-) comp16113_c0_seq13:2962-4011(-)